MLHIDPISLPSKSKDMEYSEDFKNMVKAHQGKFIGYGNPNASVLIIVPKKDVEGLAVYNTGNSMQWLSNIEYQSDFDNVGDFFVDGQQVGDESTFNPLYPLKGQRNILQKSKDGTVVCNDGTSLSWQRYQDLFGDSQHNLTDQIDFFKYAFYTVFDEELLKDSYYQKFQFIMYTFLDEEEFEHQKPTDLFGMRFLCGHDYPVRVERYDSMHSEMVVTVSLEKASKTILQQLKSIISNPFLYMFQIDTSYVRKCVDKLAIGEISDPNSRKKLFGQIRQVFDLIDILTDDIDCVEWANTWIYAFHNLKEEFGQKFLNDKRIMYGYGELFSVAFIIAPCEVVREIVSYIIDVDRKYWRKLSNILGLCHIERKVLIKKNFKPYIPKETYQMLMDIFQELKSEDCKTILIGKLIWLKRVYIKKYGKKFEY